MSTKSRRDFIKTGAKAGLAVTSLAVLPDTLFAASKVISESPLAFDHIETSFDQSPLGYDYKALEPVIDAQTMEIHYSKHAATYAKTLKEAAEAEKIDTSKPLEDVLKNISKYTVKVRNNGGGHYNHELFWKSLTANGSGKASGKLLAAIEKDFNSFDAFKTQFTEAAKTRFGSGWAWLVVGADNKLKIGSTPNQDNPLMPVSDLKGFPVLGLDVWEHAYYLKYQNRRPEYVEAWWKVVNWDFVGKRFEAGK